MKTYLLIIGFICSSILSFSQDVATDFSGNMGNQTRNPNSDYMNFVPNEVIIKFKDATPITTGSRVRRAGVSSVDKVMQAYGVTSLEKLFPSEQKPKQARIITDPQGKDITVPALDKIYKVSIPTSQSADSVPANIYQLIEDLKALPEVEYAEPNYIYSIDDLQPVGPVLTADDLVRMQPSKQNNLTDEVIPNDPLYSQQWYISAVKADSVWKQTTGDTTQVIGILDTGVDWNHPDLKNKIWTNPDEIPGNGIDDDGNGLIDDIRGWDYINNDNNPMDDNSHGTHVAGIAAAETNNGIGIAGVNWGAKIMPIKVFQSSGRGDVATITQGIVYAKNKGVTVINMSFGGYDRSMAMEDVLENAYATTILVAAAGNDGYDVSACPPIRTCFPAALSYVLGVTCEGIFTNTDCTGPTYSNVKELFNYELRAPGVGIISTIPNGNYRMYSGTSMAAPIVSSALSLYRIIKNQDEESIEEMWTKLIQSSGSYIDVFKCIDFIPKPELRLIETNMIDSIVGDNDGKVDAGEKISLWYKIRNTGGLTDSTWIKLQLSEFEDSTTVKFIKPMSFIGSVSSYATLTSQNDPITIQISPNVAHDRDIVFNLLMWNEDVPDTTVQEVVLRVENGTHLDGILINDFTLTPDKYWIINKSLRISSGVKLTILPGTKMEINSNVDNRGYVESIGTKDSIIHIKGLAFGGSNKYKYTHFDITNTNIVFCSTNTLEFCKFYSNIYTFSSEYLHGISAPNIKNCSFESLDFLGYFGWLISAQYITDSYIKDVLTNDRYFSGIQINKCIFENLHLRSSGGGNPLISSSLSNSVIDNLIVDYDHIVNSSAPAYLLNTSSSVSNNSFLANDLWFRFVSTSGSLDYISLPNNYWGSTDSLKIRKKYFDFENNAGIPYLFTSPRLNAPSDSCHAHVWKILVNGKDAQDDYMEPIGVGKQRFDVYFNRKMDNTIIPQVSFGVRYPYTQQAVNEDGSWSEDGRIYTAYKTTKLTTGDGINQIRVAGAKELNGWDFEIPVEDSRFSFIVSAANSASVDFMATPGLGKVNLEWNNNNLDDGLGYNMYRLEHINDSTLTEPVIINSSLITDTLYTDYSVVPNKKYYYLYKIVRTDLSETDQSKVVSAIPFTASKGDANGDLSVNVLDITSIVAYLLNNNPQPFIFEAADVNNDVNINVLDIVGVVNKVLNRVQSVFGLEQEKMVELFIENDTLFISSNTEIGGIQIDINGINSMDEIQILKALDGFESGSSITSGSLRLIFYSMSGKSISAGERIPLLKLKGGSEIVNPIFGDINSSSIRVNYIQTNVDEIHNYGDHNLAAEFGKNFSSSAGAGTVIPIIINEPVDEVVIHVINMAGQEVWTNSLKNPYVGEHLLLWNSGAKKGVFVCRLEIKKGNRKQISPVKKLIVH